MQEKLDIGIVIPCYNEEQNFLHTRYRSFLETNSNTVICFVNDGSTDHTLNILTNLGKEFANHVVILNLKTNSGKAEAVRQGIHHLNNLHSLNKIGFIDADLAVSLEESIQIAALIQDPIVMAFGSRISKVGSHIDRQFHRFIIGRFIATIISNILDLKVYDTQCGCKFFSLEESKELFKKPFITKWLFDVELFFRMQKSYGKQDYQYKMYEAPLKRWVDRGDSKVKFSYGFKVFFDLLSIRNAYKK